MRRPIDLVLDYLDRVVKMTDHQWMARCPAHDDRDPSLSVRELDDGKVLLHCHAGCEIESILDAMGLEMKHLFPATSSIEEKMFRNERLGRRDNLKLLAEHSWQLSFGARDLLANKKLDQKDLRTLEYSTECVARAINGLFSTRVK